MSWRAGLEGGAGEERNWRLPQGMGRNLPPPSFNAANASPIQVSWLIGYKLPTSLDLSPSHLCASGGGFGETCGAEKRDLAAGEEPVPRTEVHAMGPSTAD
uniref:Uncharacterized protein n=1 Tax=Setaria viridis TaxID=4556 RepID=A0A4U6SV67_SETVI|nr:hypothetical protein SEVIR_9G180850v2 [Setaria viridis]